MLSDTRHTPFFFFTTNPDLLAHTGGVENVYSCRSDSADVKGTEPREESSSEAELVDDNAAHGPVRMGRRRS